MADKVYYDESCYVCSLEINAVRSRGEACGIEFIDISADDFDGNVKDFEKEMIGWFDQKALKHLGSCTRKWDLKNPFGFLVYPWSGQCLTRGIIFLLMVSGHAYRGKENEFY